MGKRKSTPTSLTMKKAAAAEGDQTEDAWEVADLKIDEDFQLDPYQAAEHPSEPSPSSPESVAQENGLANGQQIPNGMNSLLQTLQTQGLFEQHQNGLNQSSKNFLDFMMPEGDSFSSRSPQGSASGESTPMLDRHYWSEEETNLLMELYVKNLSRFKERRHTGITIWEEIATEIKDTLGIAVTGDQCHSKLRNMKRTYIRATARGTAPYPPDTTRDQQLVMKGTGGSMQKVTVPAPLAEMFASSLPVNFTNPSSFPQSLAGHQLNSLSGMALLAKNKAITTVAAASYTPPSVASPQKVIHNRTPSLVRPTGNASTQTSKGYRRSKTQSLILKTIRREQVENRMFRERMQRENLEQFGLLLRCVSDLSQSVADIKRALGQP